LCLKLARVSPDLTDSGRLFMAVLWNRASHYIFALWFLSFFFLSCFSSPNLSSRKVDVYHTYTHGVALVQIQNATLKCAARSSLEIQDATRMWADAQCDGRPAEYGWCPLRKFRNSSPCTTTQSWLRPSAGVPCSNAANIRERKT